MVVRLYQFLGYSKFGLLLFEIIHICHIDNLNICFSSTIHTLVQNFQDHSELK